MADEQAARPAPASAPRQRVIVSGVLAAVMSLAILAVGPIRAADPTPGDSPAPSASVDPSASPSPTVEPTPTPTPAPTPIYTTRSAYSPGSAVRQKTPYWCVPASTQIMLNIILHRKDTTKATQVALAKLIGVNNRYRYTVPGNDIRGWAKALNARIPANSGIMYRDRAFKSQSRAMWAIVEAIRDTGYPVGITVWHGGHAWTVVGYRLRHMPATPDRKSIAGFYVVGPLKKPGYSDPFPSATARRGIYYTVSRFAAQFSWYDEDRKRAPWHRAYVMVRPEPVTAAPGY